MDIIHPNIILQQPLGHGHGLCLSETLNASVQPIIDDQSKQNTFQDLQTENKNLSAMIKSKQKAIQQLENTKKQLEVAKAKTIKNSNTMTNLLETARRLKNAQRVDTYRKQNNPYKLMEVKEMIQDLEQRINDKEEAKRDLKQKMEDKEEDIVDRMKLNSQMDVFDTILEQFDLRMTALQSEQDETKRRIDMHYEWQALQRNAYTNTKTVKQRYYLSHPISCVHYKSNAIDDDENGVKVITFLSYDLLDDEKGAVKLYVINDDEKQQICNARESIQNEYSILKGISHPNIVSLFDQYAVDNNTFWMVFSDDFGTGMFLDAYLRKKKTLAESVGRSLIIQLFRAVAHLHGCSPTIIHTDLKPEIIWFNEGNLKITDLFLSQTLEGDEDKTTLKRTPHRCYSYLPHDIRNNDIDNEAMISANVDVWSVGAIFYLFLFGIAIGEEQPLSFPDDPKTSEEVKRFISQCCEDTMTLSSNDIVDNHSYFAYLR
eukprot:222665_1